MPISNLPQLLGGGGGVTSITPWQSQNKTQIPPDPQAHGPCSPVLFFLFSSASRSRSPCKRPCGGILASANHRLQSQKTAMTNNGALGTTASLNPQIPPRSSKTQLLPSEPQTTDDMHTCFLPPPREPMVTPAC